VWLSYPWRRKRRRRRPTSFSVVSIPHTRQGNQDVLVFNFSMMVVFDYSFEYQKNTNIIMSLVVADDVLTVVGASFLPPREKKTKELTWRD
jgi:hypothetical protein